MHRGARRRHASGCRSRGGNMAAKLLGAAVNFLHLGRLQVTGVGTPQLCLAGAAPGPGPRTSRTPPRTSRTRGEPAQGHDLIRAHTHGLVLLEKGPDVVLAVWIQSPRIFGLDRPDVSFFPKGETAEQQAVHDDAHAPDVDLRTVVPIEDLGRPKFLGAHSCMEPLIFSGPTSGAEVAERDVTIGVGELDPVHDKVIAFNVPMNDGVPVQVLHSSRHLQADVV
mmetsp:Transcript_54252/g.116502  ORF Transcript_54252/g.116502 Transcript_54252/m.116502 type:complete len:223 (-) Transcript_54252:439-1107(-)